MLQIIGCPDTTCKHNRDGQACTCQIVKMELGISNNQPCVMCTSYEESEEYKNESSKNSN